MREIQNISIRHLVMDDFEALNRSMHEAYPDMEGSTWSRKSIQKLLDLFPEGQIAVCADDVLVGCALAIRVPKKLAEKTHTYSEITGNLEFKTHSPEGEVLYGIDVFIHPKYRGLRLGRRLYDARKELCEHLNLQGIVFGGRMPKYAEHSAELSPRQYIEKVKIGEIIDPVLRFQLGNDFHVKKVLKGYLPGDVNSEEYAVLMGWNNIYYTDPEEFINTRKSVVRLGLVQWQMRSVSGIEEMFDQMEFFVDAVSGYKSDFALFPELFNAPLMSAFNDLPETEAIRKLSEFTPKIRDKFREMAMSYNINIICGSMPFLEDGQLYNAGFLCHRDGRVDTYYKIHITPNEVQHWGISGGDSFQVFDTDCGRIGVQICYDVEFPELGRIMAEDGMDILFVPFLTDTQNGYTRVMRCAQARAIENECYVAIAGSVGNLPRVSNMDIQFAQSGVFTPSDFSFPTNGVKAEATQNTEMTLIVDVDIDLLRQLHAYGSVTNLRDRRKDLYALYRKQTGHEES